MLIREATVYLAPPAQGQGLGRRLYDDLLSRLLDDRWIDVLWR